MQFHPDSEELKQYLRGRSPVASVIKQHLLTCDECVAHALAEYDRLDRMRTGGTTRNPRVGKKEAAPVPVLKSLMVPEPRESVWRHAWVALFPVTLAVGFLLQAHTQEGSAPIARAKIARLLEHAATPIPEAPKLESATEDEEPVSVARVEHFESTSSMRQESVARAFILPLQVEPARVTRQPIFLPPAELEGHILSPVKFHKLAALSSATAEPSLLPPPKKRPGLMRIFSALAAPFRRSS